MVHVNS